MSSPADIQNHLLGKAGNPSAYIHTGSYGCTFWQKTQTIQQSLSACEVRRVLFLIHRSRDAPADKTLCFFFLHFLRFLCIYFMVLMQKSQWSFPRPNVMLLSQMASDAARYS